MQRRPLGPRFSADAIARTYLRAVGCGLARKSRRALPSDRACLAFQGKLAPVEPKYTETQEQQREADHTPFRYSGNLDSRPRDAEGDLVEVNFTFTNISALIFTRLISLYYLVP